jgi:hypothetical protein
MRNAHYAQRALCATLRRGRARTRCHRVFDLAEVSKGLWLPEDKLRLWKDVHNLKVLVCGGDGTMGWMFSSIDRCVLPRAAERGLALIHTLIVKSHCSVRVHEENMTHVARRRTCTALVRCNNHARSDWWDGWRMWQKPLRDCWTRG